MATLELHATRQLRVFPIANAVTVAALLTYLVCRVASIVVPEGLAALARSWFHGLAIDATPWSGFESGEFLVGAITLAAFIWVFTAFVAWLYNAWSREA